jgi:AbrB family looped-hinge helix DNA binding protein
MPLKIEVSVMQVGTSLRITIPKEVATHLDLKKGDTVAFWADNNHVFLEKKQQRKT